MISVIVIAKNEQDLIKNCLESVKWADEIIVALNDSTDDTEKIVRNFTKKVIKIPGQDFAKVRNDAFKETSGDWVLYVDADERVSKKLKEEILNLTQNTLYSAFAISRENIILGKLESYRAFWPDWVIRLLKREDFETWIGKVHEYAKFNGPLGYTTNSFIHLTHRDLDHMVLKSLEWSHIDAKLRLDAHHPRIKGWRLMRIFITEIYNQGVKRRGFFNGTRGVIDSMLQTFSLVMTYIRLWEMQQPEPLSKIYQDIDHQLLKDNFDY